METFEESVKRNLGTLQFESVGACPGCDVCTEFPGSEGTEFSRYPCELCDSSLAGERMPAHAVDVDDDHKIYHFDVCVDCYYYIGVQQ